MVTGPGEVVVVVLQVPEPLAIGPAAPVQTVTVIVEGAVASPLLSTKFTMLTVQAMPWPPTLLAVLLLH